MEDLSWVQWAGREIRVWGSEGASDGEKD